MRFLAEYEGKRSSFQRIESAPFLGLFKMLASIEQKWRVPQSSLLLQ
jgi:hypothetical protein